MNDELKIMPLSKEKIDEIFEKADEQWFYFLALYQCAYPRWKDVGPLDGYPTVGKETHAYLFAKAVAFDKKHPPHVMAGGFRLGWMLWMNSGFGMDEKVPEWHVKQAPLKKKEESDGS